jgi:hypothetical protein
VLDSTVGEFPSLYSPKHTQCIGFSYSIYCYFFLSSNRESELYQFASTILRPIFQWLSLLSSSLNPLIYIAYSQKYRRAFHHLLLTPCRIRYRKLQRVTRATLRLPPLPQTPTDTTVKKGSINQAHWTTITGDGEVLNKWGRKISLQHSNAISHRSMYYLDKERKFSDQPPPRIISHSTSPLIKPNGISSSPARENGRLAKKSSLWGKEGAEMNTQPLLE